MPAKEQRTKIQDKKESCVRAAGLGGAMAAASLCVRSDLFEHARGLTQRKIDRWLSQLEIVHDRGHDRSHLGYFLQPLLEVSLSAFLRTGHLNNWREPWPFTGCRKLLT